MWHPCCRASNKDSIDCWIRSKMCWDGDPKHLRIQIQDPYHNAFACLPTIMIVTALQCFVNLVLFIQLCDFQLGLVPILPTIVHDDLFELQQRYRDELPEQLTAQEEWLLLEAQLQEVLPSLRHPTAAWFQLMRTRSMTTAAKRMQRKMRRKLRKFAVAQCTLQWRVAKQKQRVVTRTRRVPRKTMLSELLQEDEVIAEKLDDDEFFEALVRDLSRPMMVTESYETVEQYTVYEDEVVADDWKGGAIVVSEEYYLPKLQLALVPRIDNNKKNRRGENLGSAHTQHSLTETRSEDAPDEWEDDDLRWVDFPVRYLLSLQLQKARIWSRNGNGGWRADGLHRGWVPSVRNLRFVEFAVDEAAAIRVER